ncbi:hypothetical protein ISN44_As09g026210 [Arabidopsis suecica]|uniref:Uncharacterized protein n=1 Tax=Arabidopsis suecica TaxID=45249 RepID=A0A8T2ANA2_ARASU|nr:hypothetical protein ISN44_As09g026210 [Arabidopsis suecica]
MGTSSRPELLEPFKAFSWKKKKNRAKLCSIFKIWRSTMLGARTNGHQASETTRKFNLVKAPEDTRVNPRDLPRGNAIVDVLVETPNGKASWWKVMNQLNNMCVNVELLEF